MSTTNFGSSPAGFWFSTNCNNPGYYICKRQAGVQCSAAPPATVTPSPANPSNCNAGRLMSDGIITSPNFPQNYFNNANCAYQISTLGSMRIALTFTFFNTQPYDLVTIYDGETSSSPVLGKYGGNQSSLTFTSSRNNMLVTFITDGKDTSNGFSARFSSIVYGNIWYREEHQDNEVFDFRFVFSTFRSYLLSLGLRLVESAGRNYLTKVWSKFANFW